MKKSLTNSLKIIINPVLNDGRSTESTREKKNVRLFLLPQTRLIMVDCSSDVYISFNRWEDTVRYSFVSHLSAAFHRRGISSFIGEDNNGFSKLENCRASVVVFSEKYSSSKSCLEELVKLSNRRRNNCLAVVPVFYPVMKHFVKKQIWNLEDGDFKSALLEMVDLPGPKSYDKQRYFQNL